MDNLLILQNFYNGLTQLSRDHVDAAAGGAFFSLAIERATSLIEKMVSNQGWSMIASNRASEVCTPSRRPTCSLRRLISSSRNLRIIPKIRLRCKHFKPWKLT